VDQNFARGCIFML